MNATHFFCIVAQSICSVDECENPCKPTGQFIFSRHTDYVMSLLCPEKVRQTEKSDMSNRGQISFPHDLGMRDSSWALFFTRKGSLLLMMSWFVAWQPRQVAEVNTWYFQVSSPWVARPLFGVKGCVTKLSSFYPFKLTSQQVKISEVTCYLFKK